MIVQVNDYVTIGKSKQAKSWKVIGLMHPLPHMGGGNAIPTR